MVSVVRDSGNDTYELCPMCFIPYLFRPTSFIGFLNLCISL